MKKMSIWIGLGMAACSPWSEIANPTGDCEAPDDGGRVCYHSPEEGDQYLPDCEAPLDREYWRVFAQSEESAYMIPRPDAAGLTWGICGGEDAALEQLFDLYGLCDEAVDPGVVNALAITDALAISHALHERLVFTAVDRGDGAWDLSPWAPEIDLADACEGPGADRDDLAAVCSMLIDRISGDVCTDIGIVYDQAEAEGLAEIVNQLYGVE